MEKHKDYTKGATLKVYLGKELRKRLSKAQKTEDYNASERIRRFLDKELKKYGY